MTSRFAVLAIDALDEARIVRFWCQVLGWQVREVDGPVVTIGPDSGAWPTIDVCRIPERKTVKNRLHLDLRADGSPTEVELARLLELGATRVDIGQAVDATWVLLADPEGNEFCLLSRAVQELPDDERDPADRS